MGEIICACGCGNKLEEYDKYGRIRKYINTHHKFKRNRVCSICNTKTSSKRKNGIEQWHTNKGKHLCHKCFEKYIHGPVYAPIRNAKHNPNLLLFKKKRILLKYNPRTGVCSLCRYQGKTDIHHMKYDKEDPLKYTIELCRSCHSKEGWELGQYDNRNTY